MAETYPLPPDPALAALTAALNDAGHWAEVVDEHWNWVFITDDLRKSYGKPGTPAEFPLGTFYFGPEAEASRTRVVGGPSFREASRIQLAGYGAWALADLGGDREALRAAVDPWLADLVDDLPEDDGRDVRTVHQVGGSGTGLAAVDVPTFGIRVRRPDRSVAGTAIVMKPAAGMATLAALSIGGDLAHFERMYAVNSADRRPAAILFADLESSSPLSKRLPTASYFALARRLVRAADDAVIAAGGLVGRHVGDGTVAFFLAEHAGSESAAARGCIEAARALRASAADVAARSGLAPEDLTLRMGLHWGSTLYVGSVISAGRSEVTALGDEVNEAARIEACATGGRVLASKELVERLTADDAAALEIDLRAATYTPLGDLPTATEKARRDAPAIAVRDV